jgi:hypothetical protein
MEKKRTMMVKRKRNRLLVPLIWDFVSFASGSCPARAQRSVPFAKSESGEIPIFAGGGTSLFVVGFFVTGRVTKSEIRIRNQKAEGRGQKAKIGGTD